MNKKLRIASIAAIIMSLLVGGYFAKDFYYSEKFNEKIGKIDLSPAEFPSDFQHKILFDKACRLIKEDQNKSIEYFQKIIQESDDKFLKVDSLYNLGWIFTIRGLQENKPEIISSAIEYYKEALRLRPDFWKAKYNLESLLKILSKTKSSDGNDKQKNENEGKNKEEKDQSPDKDNNQDSKDKLKKMPPSSNPELGDEL